MCKKLYWFLGILIFHGIVISCGGSFGDRDNSCKKLPNISGYVYKLEKDAEVKIEFSVISNECGDFEGEGNFILSYRGGIFITKNGKYKIFGNSSGKEIRMWLERKEGVNTESFWFSFSPSNSEYTRLLCSCNKNDVPEDIQKLLGIWVRQ